LIAWWLLQRRVGKREKRIRSLQTALKGKEVSLLDLRARLRAQEADAERVRRELTQRDQAMRDLTVRIEQQNQVVGRLVAVHKQDSLIGLERLEELLQEATRRLLQEDKSQISKS
jgi:predicted RNase H-like nuclease (RuvC/YqgF family)